MDIPVIDARSHNYGDQGKSSFETLITSYTEAVSVVPVLSRHFASKSKPQCWTEWRDLPTTSSQLYSQIDDVRIAVRQGSILSNIRAPLDLQRPSFPLPVFQSQADAEAIKSRLSHILYINGLTGRKVIRIYAGSNERYAAADLADALIFLGHRVQLVLSAQVTKTQMTSRMRKGKADAIFWLHESNVTDYPVASDVPIITFNKNCITCNAPLHINVIYLDHIPYLASSTADEAYSAAPGHFHLETTSRGELLITTLKQDLFPVIRYASGLFADLTSDGFVLRKTATCYP